MGAVYEGLGPSEERLALKTLTRAGAELSFRREFHTASGPSRKTWWPRSSEASPSKAKRSPPPRSNSGAGSRSETHAASPSARSRLLDAVAPGPGDAHLFALFADELTPVNERDRSLPPSQGRDDQSRLHACASARISACAETRSRNDAR